MIPSSSDSDLIHGFIHIYIYIMNIYILSILLFSMKYVQHILWHLRLHVYNIVINAVPVCASKYRHFVRLKVTGS